MKVALLGAHPVDLRADGTIDAGAAPLAGGVDAVVRALSAGLARCPELDLTVVTAVAGLAQPIAVSHAGYTIRCVPRPRGGRWTGHRRVVSMLQAELAVIAPDVVHAHSGGIYGRAAQLSGLPYVITLHGLVWREMQQAWPTSPWGARMRWLFDALFERSVVRGARDLIAISPYVQREFSSRTNARFRLIENPIDDRFFSVPAALPSEPRLLCVARVIPRKGILALIRAFAQVVEAQPAATLTIVGEATADPAYTAACAALSAELDLAGRVTFAGGRDLDGVAAELASARLFVLASEQETAPVSIAEAMAAGRPVVTTAAGGCAEMVEDGVSGRVTPVGDVAAFASAVRGLLDSPARLAACGAAARERARRRWQLDSIVASTLEVYRSLGGAP